MTHLIATTHAPPQRWTHTLDALAQTHRNTYQLTPAALLNPHAPLPDDALAWLVTASPDADAAAPPLGVALLWDLDRRHRLASCGVCLHTPAHLHAAFHALAHRAFNTLNLHRLELHTSPDAPHLTTLAALGFQREGLLRQHRWDRGVYRDTLALGLLHSDFLRLAQPPAP